MQSRVQVIDKNSGEVLFRTDMDKMSMAYEFAREMEEMGLDVEVKAPDIHETLADTLGVKPEDRSEYSESLAHEIDAHDDSCCRE
jgi:hypothetical protein